MCLQFIWFSCESHGMNLYCFVRVSFGSVSFCSRTSCLEDIYLVAFFVCRRR